MFSPIQCAESLIRQRAPNTIKVIEAGLNGDVSQLMYTFLSHAGIPVRLHFIKHTGYCSFTKGKDYQEHPNEVSFI